MCRRRRSLCLCPTHRHRRHLRRRRQHLVAHNLALCQNKVIPKEGITLFYIPIEPNSLRALERACRLRLSLAAGRDLVFVSVFDAALNADVHFFPTAGFRPPWNFLDLFLRFEACLSRLVLILYIYEDLKLY